MKTEIFKISSLKKSNSEILKAAKFIKKGKLVAFPTETVYGLGASAFDFKAIKKIFLVKGRPQNNPLIVHISSKEQLSLLTDDVPIKAELLIKEFWPGPLTIVFKKKKDVPSIVTAGLDSVAVRMPKNKIALKLIEESKVPIVAPSANLSTKPSPTLSKHVISDLYGKIECIIDGGKTNIGIESTVIDLTSSVPIILRPGQVTKEEIEKIIGKVGILKNKKISKSKNLKSPGLKYKHYSPDARVYLVRKDFDFYESVLSFITKNKLSDKRIALFYIDSSVDFIVDSFNEKNINLRFIKKYKDIKDYAKNIFSDFREADFKKIDLIFIQGIEEKEFGYSLMNRLKKASFKEI